MQASTLQVLNGDYKPELGFFSPEILGAKRDEDNAPMRVILYKAVYGNFHGC
jgi:hypothetical protein